MVQQKTKHYQYLTQDEREEIFKHKEQGKSFRWIGKKLGRSHTTVSREWRRNSEDLGRDKYKYSPSQAQKKYEERRANANFWHVKLWKNHRYRTKMIQMLKTKGKERGLDEIIGRMNSKGYGKISTSTGYRFIRYDMLDLQKHLRFGEKGYRTSKKGNKRKKRYTDVPNIGERPESVNERKEIGHWEGDTVVSGKVSRGGVVTMLERKSRYYLIKKVGNLEAENTKITIEAMMKGEKIESATFDNGVEFGKIGGLAFQCYRADPYSSRQRGGNERSNGLFRVFVPKGSDISSYTNEEIQIIQNRINHKPRKILGYRSPYEVYHNKEMKYL